MKPQNRNLRATEKTRWEKKVTRGAETPNQSGRDGSVRAKCFSFL